MIAGNRVERKLGIGIMEQRIPDVSDRYLGTLLGQAIGDALGVPVQGMSTSEIASAYGAVDKYHPLIDESGETIEPAGQFSDKTEFALCLVESVVTANGFVDPETAGYRFVQVLNGPHAHFVDDATRLALERAEQTGDFQDGIADEHFPGSGPAARVAPIALVHALSDFNSAVFVREVMRSTFITHAHPEAVNGTLAVAYAIRLAVRRELSPSLILDEVLAFIDEDNVALKLRQARDILRDGCKPANSSIGIESIGASDYVAETVASALLLFAHYGEDFASAVEVSANSGGATTARGAIVGALCGAWASAQALPLELVDGLDGRPYILLASPAVFRVAQMRAGLFLHLHQI